MRIAYDGSDRRRYLVAWEYDGDRADWMPLVLEAEDNDEDEEE